MIRLSFVKIIFLFYIIVCHLCICTYASEISVPKILCCNSENDVENDTCTYIENVVETYIIDELELTDDESIFSSLKQGLIDSHSIIYICVMPLSIITAPIAMVIAWGTIFYAVYNNKDLAVFR